MALGKSKKKRNVTKNQLEMRKLKEQSKIAKKAINSKNLAGKREFITNKRRHKVEMAKAKSKASNIRATGLAIAEAITPVATSATVSVDAATRNKQPIINNTTYQTNKLIDPTEITTEGDNEEKTGLIIR